MLIGGALVARNLVATDWDVSVFAAFGEEAAPTLEYGERLLGDVYARSDQGHDGKFFFVLANDPWLLNPAEHASYLDRPLYRAQRILYPLLAGGFGLLGPTAIVWAMVLVNVAALGVGSVAAAVVAREMGGSSWWGLAFGLNVGLLSELTAGGAGIVGAAFVMLAVAALQHRKHGAALALLVLAALSREVFLVSAAGMAWWLWTQGERRSAVRVLVVPGIAVVSWGLYVRARLGWETGASEVQELGLPFVGFVRTFEFWNGWSVSMLIAVMIMLLLAVFMIRVLREGWLVGWAAVGFVPLAGLFTPQVWFNYYDITRAVALAITAFVVVVFAPRRPRRVAGEV